MTTDPIQNGQTPNADTLFNYPVGMMFKNFSQLLFNAAYIGFNANLAGAGSPSLKNITYAHNLGSNYLSLGSWDFSFTTDTFAAGWTHSGAGDATSFGLTGGYTFTYLSYYNGGGNGAHSYIIPNGTKPMTLENGSYMTNFWGGGSNIADWAAVEVYDGTNAVNILFASTAGFSSARRRLNIDKTNKTCNLTANLNDLTKTGIDLATLDNSQTWYIRMHVWKGNSGSPNSASCNCSELKKMSSSVANEYIFDLGAISATDCIITSNTTSIGTKNAVVTVSSDGGAHYESFVDSEIHRFTNAGSNLKLKFQLTSDASLYMTKLNEYAVWYNCGAT